MTPAHSRRPSMAGSEASAANHHRGDSSGGQNRYESSLNLPKASLTEQIKKLRYKFTEFDPI